MTERKLFIMTDETKSNDTVQMKTRSIRASEEVLNKFKALSEEFENQSDCLEQLITAYEINTAKHTLTGLETDISDYQVHIDSIQRAFLHILELNSHTEERVKAQFRASIESKDKSIIELQHNADELRKSIEEVKANYESRLEMLETENNSLNSEKFDIMNRLTTSEKLLSEKDSIITDKQIIIDNLNAEIAGYSELKEINAELSVNISELEKTLKIKADSEVKTAARIEELEKHIKASEEEHKKELAITTKECEADKRAAVLDAREQQQAKIEKQAEKISELMEQINKITAENMELKQMIKN